MVTRKSRDAIIDALLTLVAEGGWEKTTLDGLAERAGVSLAQLREAYDGRFSILADFSRRTDQAVLKGIDVEMADEPPREQLFDVLFARLEKLEPWRAAIGEILAAARRDPPMALALNRIAATSMGWMMTGAGIAATGGRGLLRAQGLALIWAQVLRIWLEDEDPGRARTMAELDRRLRQGESVVIGLDRLARLLPRRHSGEETEAPRSESGGEKSGPRRPGVYGRGD